MVEYRNGNDLPLDALMDLYRATTLGGRRPLQDRERMAATQHPSAWILRPGEPVR